MSANVTRESAGSCVDVDSKTSAPGAMRSGSGCFFWPSLYPSAGSARARPVDAEGRLVEAVHPVVGLRGDSVEAEHPLFEPAVVAVHVLDVVDRAADTPPDPVPVIPPPTVSLPQASRSRALSGSWRISRRMWWSLRVVGRATAIIPRRAPPASTPRPLLRLVLTRVVYLLRLGVSTGPELRSSSSRQRVLCAGISDVSIGPIHHDQNLMIPASRDLRLRPLAPCHVPRPSDVNPIPANRGVEGDRHQRHLDSVLAPGIRHFADVPDLDFARPPQPLPPDPCPCSPPSGSVCSHHHHRTAPVAITSVRISPLPGTEADPRGRAEAYRRDPGRLRGFGRGTLGSLDEPVTLLTRKFHSQARVISGGYHCT